MQPNGRIEEKPFTWSAGPGGTETTVMWSLEPGRWAAESDPCVPLRSTRIMRAPKSLQGSQSFANANVNCR